MKKPSATALIAIALPVIAAVAWVTTRPAPDPPPAADSRTRAPMGPPRASRPPVLPPAPLLLDDDGLPEFSNYDPDDDGYPDVDAFIAVYRRVQTPEGRIDMLDNVRTFETPDDPELNNLLIDEAARSDDAGVREAARDAMFAYGGPQAHAALGQYLETETRVIDRSELNKLLDELSSPSLMSLRKGLKGNLSSPPKSNRNPSE